MTNPSTLLQIRPQLRRVGANLDGNAFALPRGRVEQIEVAAQLVDDSRAAHARAPHVVFLFGVLRDLLERSGLRVVRPDVQDAVAVGDEIDRVADPHRIAVDRVRIGDVLLFLRREIVDDRCPARGRPGSVSTCGRRPKPWRRRFVFPSLEKLACATSGSGTSSRPVPSGSIRNRRVNPPKLLARRREHDLVLDAGPSRSPRRNPG